MKEDIFRVKSVSQFFELLGLERPNHPLIGIFDVKHLNSGELYEQYKDYTMTSDLYCVILKDGTCGIKYGRNRYDFNEGVLQFMAPDQIVRSDNTHTPSNYGFFLVFHPDLFRAFNLNKKIKDYQFFRYGEQEALHLSKKEESQLLEIVGNLEEELDTNIDKHSQEILVTNLELILNYSKRFYNRQFITRTDLNSEVVTKVKSVIMDYYDQKKQTEIGTPSPDLIAESLNYSSTYLSDLIKKQTGKSIKEHIDWHIIDLAKHDLVNTGKTINEIAYDLGFNYPHYFSRLFRKKTGKSPVEFRSHKLN